MRPLLSFPLAALALAVLASAQGRRAEIVEVARGFAEHRWRGSQPNALHGPDADGVHVDTPDAGHVAGGWSLDGAPSTGVPYQWGGFSSLEEFDAGVRAGRLAGHAPASASSEASYRAVGLDCSGLVSRAWNLPFKHSTATLPVLCYRLGSWDELLPGDIALDAGHHVMLFVEFAKRDRRTLRVIEAAVPAVHETTVALDELEREGYLPMRYKPLDPRWRDDAPALRPATLAPALGPREPAWRASGPAEEAGEWSTRPDPLRSARTGEWVEYAASHASARRAAESAYTLRFGCGAVGADSATLAIETTLGDAREERVEARALESSYLDSLLTLFLETRVVGLEVASARAERGLAAVGGGDVPAIRREATLTGHLRRADGPGLRIELVTYESEHVPLHGVLFAELRLSFGAPDEAASICERFGLASCRDE